MNYREIKLSNGKVVTVENFKMEFIYDGILVGKPNKEINDRLISNVIKTFNSNKVLVLMDDAYASEDILKPIVFSAQFVAEPINDIERMFDGSYLNIIWFGDDFKSNTIKNLIMNLKGFEFDLNAENYIL
jgi:hypothetical protein